MACLLVGCSRLPSPTDLPIVYKIDIEQGNVITQDMLAQLRPGMDKAKVRFIMGTPIIEDTFHANRWDYIYSFSHRGGRREQRRVALFFEDDLLVQVDGNVRAAVGELKPEREKSAMVEVPGVHQRSLIDKMKARVGLGDDTPDEGDDDADEAAEASGAPGAGVAAAAGEDDAEAAQGREDEDAPAEEADAGKDEPGLFARMARRVGIGDDEQPGGDETGTGEATAEAGSDDEATGETMVAKQSRPEESVLVPENAPPPKRDKGLFRSILEKVGIGDDGADDPAGPADRGYKDPTEIDQPF